QGLRGRGPRATTQRGRHQAPLPRAARGVQDSAADRIHCHASPDRVRKDPPRGPDPTNGDHMSVLDWNVLDLDYTQEADRICARIREITARQLHRRGLVVAISGGIDSSASVALAVRALGPERVFGLILPERDSS